MNSNIKIGILKYLLLLLFCPGIGRAVEVMVVIANTTPYSVTVQAPIGPGTLVETIKMAPKSSITRIVSRTTFDVYYSQMFIKATYRANSGTSTSNRYYSFTPYYPRPMVRAEIWRPSPGIIRLR